ncbi:MAG: RNA-binding protein [Pseudomonadota bacterium]
MADLLMGNVESGTSDEDIRAFLVKYGFPPFDELEHVAGDGSRPAVLLTFKDAAPEALRSLVPRIQDLFWKNRKIHVQVISERYL